MAVTLHLFDPDTARMIPLWSNFLDQIKLRCLHKHGALMSELGEDLEDQELMAELERFGAWTDWDNNQDPVWFPDYDQLTQFVLTWS